MSCIVFKPSLLKCCAIIKSILVSSLYLIIEKGDYHTLGSQGIQTNNIISHIRYNHIGPVIYIFLLNIFITIFRWSLGSGEEKKLREQWDMNLAVSLLGFDT